MVDTAPPTHLYVHSHQRTPPPAVSPLRRSRSSPPSSTPTKARASVAPIPPRKVRDWSCSQLQNPPSQIRSEPPSENRWSEGIPNQKPADAILVGPYQDVVLEGGLYSVLRNIQSRRDLQVIPSLLNMETVFPAVFGPTWSNRILQYYQQLRCNHEICPSFGDLFLGDICVKLLSCITGNLVDGDGTEGGRGVERGGEGEGKVEGKGKVEGEGKVEGAAQEEDQDEEQEEGKEEEGKEQEKEQEAVKKLLMPEDAHTVPATNLRLFPPP
ncbi:hypothetical protein B0H19DRAFT_1254688 [Mycena capillaripes]|nr:hypothetical protein B0H19DRAFT_1254688 [Mycena capillaripes]